MSSTAKIRCFVAASPDATTREQIGRAQARLAARLTGFDVRWTALEQVHVTLRFFGHIPAERVEAVTKALHEAASGFPPMTLAIENAGCFPSWQRPQVIWFGLGGDEAVLERLQAAVERTTGALAQHSEARKFHPHLTIGRMKTDGRRGRQAGEVLQSAAVGRIAEWPVNEIVLMQSQLSPSGSQYTGLAAIPLRGAPG